MEKFLFMTGIDTPYPYIKYYVKSSASGDFVFSDKINSQESWRALRDTSLISANGGFTGQTLTATSLFRIDLDLQRQTQLIGFNYYLGSANAVPKNPMIYTSNDGINYTLLKSYNLTASDAKDSTSELYAMTKNPSLMYLFNLKFDNIINTRYIRLETGGTVGVRNSIAATTFQINYVSLEIPNPKTVKFQIENSITGNLVVDDLTATIKKNGIFYENVTIKNGTFKTEALDDTSTWTIEIPQSSNYNSLSPQRFYPSESNPTVNINLVPVVIKKFNFFDENNVSWSSKSLTLKIYKDNATIPIFNRVVTSGNITTSKLYIGDYRYEVTSDGYTTIVDSFPYNSNEVNVKLELYIPLNKTLILHDGEYKKWTAKKEAQTIESLVPKMTSKTTPLGIVTSSSVYSSEYEDWKVFDMNPMTAWSTPSGNNINQFIGYEFNAPVASNRYSLLPSGNSAVNLNQMPKRWSFQGSNDNLTWVDLDVKSNMSWQSYIKKDFEFINTNAYKSYRIYMYENNGHVNFSLGEFQIGQTIEAIPSELVIISSTLPTSQQFLSDGMDSLSPLLDRKVTTLEPIIMTERNDILQTDEEGKIFSSSISLNKYFDLRNIKVEVK